VRRLSRCGGVEGAHGFAAVSGGVRRCGDTLEGACLEAPTR